MTGLTQFVREAGRRNLLGTLGIFVGGGWAVLQVLDLFIERGFLPEWTFNGALLALVLGLPVVLSTAWIQGARRLAEQGDHPDQGDHEGPASDSDGERDDVRAVGPDLADVLTWNRAILGGLFAFAFLGVLTVGYMAMRVTGIGAPGTLAAQGTFEVGGQVVLADFQSSVPDEAPSDLITESLRIDLASSPAIQLIERSTVSDALELMVVDPASPLDEQRSRDVAVRVGAEGVLSGEIGKVGSSYVLTARLLAAESGDALASFRQTAESPDELLDAIDALSDDMRTKIGESLRSVAASESLRGVTTTSLEALKRYTYVSSRLYRTEMDTQVGLQMLEEAIALDSTFAVANLQLAISINNWGGSLERARLATEQAFRHRERLTDRERLSVEAYYYSRRADTGRAAQAYRRIIELAPDNRSAHINLSDLSMYAGDYQDAVDLLNRVPSPDNQVWTWNMQAALTALGRVDDALAAADAYAATGSGSGAGEVSTWARVMIHYVSGDLNSARAELDAAPPPAPGFEDWNTVLRADVAALSGNPSAARELLTGLAVKSVRNGNDFQHVLAAIELGLLAAWVERNPAGIRPAMGVVFDRVDLNDVPPRDRFYPLQALVYAIGQDTEAVRELGDRYRAEVDQPSDPEGRASMAAAEVLAQLRRGDEEGLRRLEQEADGIRCARCAGLVIGLGAEFTGQTDRAIQEYEAYLATPFFDGSDPLMRVFSTNVHERLGALYEEVGDLENSARHCRIFAERWENADAPLQPRVRYALERSAGLQ